MFQKKNDTILNGYVVLLYLVGVVVLFGVSYFEKKYTERSINDAWQRIQLEEKGEI